jgi:multidrug resistance protein, MATE family
MSRMGRLRAESRATFMLALPIVTGQLLTISMNVIDTMLAGRLGTQVLAAVSMGYQIWVLALLVVIGMMLAVTPTVSQLDGAGRRGEVGVVFRQALWLALFIGGALFVALHFAEPVLTVARVDPAIIPDAIAFMRAIAWGAPPLALFFACKNTSEGLSLTRPTMYFSALAVAVLAPTAYVLMYGKLGLPALGAAGAGYAHAITLWVEALAFLFYLHRRKLYASARLFERFDRPNFAQIGALLRLGVPMGISICMEGGLFVATALLAGRLGETTAAAHQIAINVASVAFMLPMGIGMATTVRVGYAAGRGDPSSVGWAGLAGLLLTLACQIASILVISLLPYVIVGAYTSDVAVTALAISLLWYAAVFQLSDGIQALANGALRGLKDTAVPAVVTTIAYWAIGFPLGWWLGITRGHGAPGLWTGFIAGLSVAAAFLTIRFVILARRLARRPPGSAERQAAA